MSRKGISLDKNPLFGGPSLAERQKTGSPYREISISEIDVDPEQPRRVFDEQALSELSESIKEFGVLSPVLVRLTEGGSYRLIAGERRFRASKLAGLKTIPAIIDSKVAEDEGSILPKQLVENLQRQDLSSMERALAIGTLKRELGLSVRDIASKLGVSKSLVQRSLDILSLPEDLQSALIAGASESKIFILANVGNQEVRKQILPRLEELSRTQLEAMIQELISGQASEVSHRGTLSSKKKTQVVSLEDQRIADEIQKALGTRVSIQRSSSKSEQGKLILEFYSTSDLDEIHQKLTS